MTTVLTKFVNRRGTFFFPHPESGLLFVGPSDYETQQKRSFSVVLSVQTCLVGAAVEEYSQTVQFQFAIKSHYQSLPKIS